MSDKAANSTQNPVGDNRKIRKIITPNTTPFQTRYLHLLFFLRNPEGAAPQTPFPALHALPCASFPLKTCAPKAPFRLIPSAEERGSFRPLLSLDTKKGRSPPFVLPTKTVPLGANVQRLVNLFQEFWGFPLYRQLGFICPPALLELLIIAFQFFLRNPLSMQRHKVGPLNNRLIGALIVPF